jgi:hypothetical protein
MRNYILTIVVLILAANFCLGLYGNDKMYSCSKNRSHSVIWNSKVSELIKQSMQYLILYPIYSTNKKCKKI